MMITNVYAFILFINLLRIAQCKDSLYFRRFEDKNTDRTNFLQFAWDLIKRTFERYQFEPKYHN